jgi:formyl-CoA transferase
MTVSSNKSGGALAGLKVIDLSRVLGGPYGTQILGDHGADVIKIEPPQSDETRAWGPPFVDGTSGYFLNVNRNKRGMVLDLRNEGDREILLSLLADADILVENYKPGTMERWGLGFEDVISKRFPRLIHCRISGFGSDGPLGGLPGYDAVVQAIVGLMAVNGEPDQEPLRLGVPVVDMVTGLYAVIGILLAVAERERSGQGQFIEASLFDCALSITHPHSANFLMSGTRPVRTGNAHPNIAPYDTFATSTSPIFLAVGNDAQFAKLCALLGCELSADPRFATNEARGKNREALKTLLERQMNDMDGVELADRLIRAGVPCGPVLEVPEALAHPHTKHREMIVAIGHHQSIASPIKLSRNRATYERKPPALDEHREEILAQLRVRTGGG